MEQGLIKPTPFEVLISGYKEDRARIRAEEETNPNSERNIKRKDIIAREVQVVYTFLYELGKPYSDMSIDEFELGQKEVIKKTEAEIEGLELELSRTWFFRFIKRGRLNIKIEHLKFKLKNKYSLRISYNQFCNMVRMVGISRDRDGQDWRPYLPANLEKLVEDIFQKRHGVASDSIKGGGEYGS